MTRKGEMAGAAGFEPATLGFGDRCSTKLSYAPANSCGLGSGLHLVTADVRRSGRRDARHSPNPQRCVEGTTPAHYTLIEC